MSHTNVLSTPTDVRARGLGAPMRRLPELWHFASEYLLLLPFGALVGLV